MRGATPNKRDKTGMVRKWKWTVQRDYPYCITDASLLHLCAATIATIDNLLVPLIAASPACSLASPITYSRASLWGLQVTEIAKSGE